MAAAASQAGVDHGDMNLHVVDARYFTIPKSYFEGPGAEGVLYGEILHRDHDFEQYDVFMYHSDGTPGQQADIYFDDADIMHGMSDEEWHNFQHQPAPVSESDSPMNDSTDYDSTLEDDSGSDIGAFTPVRTTLAREWLASIGMNIEDPKAEYFPFELPPLQQLSAVNTSFEPTPSRHLGGCKTPSLPYNMFMRMFTEDDAAWLAEHSTEYASRRGTLNRDAYSGTITKDDVLCYVGCGLLLSLCGIRRIRDAWSADEAQRVTEVYNAFKCRRFEFIASHVHLHDPARRPPADMPGHRAFPVQEWLDRLQANWNAEASLHHLISVDEALLGFSGRYGAKHSNPKKPRKQGPQLQVAASSGGYVYAHILDDLKDTIIGEYNGSVIRAADLGGRGNRTMLLVAELVRRVKAASSNEHTPGVICDRGYMSPNFMLLLHAHGIKSCGPVRKNWLPPVIKAAYVEDDPEDWPRFRYRVWKIKVHGNDVGTVTTWRDRKVVHMFSTMHQDPNVHAMVDRKMGDGSVTTALVPVSVVVYNKHMQGVDVADQLRESLKFPLRAMFWYRTLFVYGIDTCVCNALKLSNAARAQRGFLGRLSRREAQFVIARQLICNHKRSDGHGQAPPVPDIPPLPEAHFNWYAAHRAAAAEAPPVTASVLAHAIGHVVEGSSRQCAGPACSTKTHWGCTGCGVVLCSEECWTSYHAFVQHVQAGNL